MNLVLEDETIANLVSFHNGLVSGSNFVPISNWKKAKSDLVERIRTRQVDLELAQAARLDAEAKAEAEAKNTSSNLFVDAHSGSTNIKESAMFWLTFVQFYEERAEAYGPSNEFEEPSKTRRSVGLPYTKVLEQVKKEFPEGKTSIACLRWYCVQVNNGTEKYEDYILPQRRQRAAKGA